MAQEKRELNEISAKTAISVKLNADVSEMIRGLKAIQREAKKATQALRELEAEARRNWTFRVGDVIEIGDDYGNFTYMCICADRETAVFAATMRADDGWNTKYNEMFAYPNTPELRDSIAGKYRMVGEELTNE